MTTTLLWVCLLGAACGIGAVLILAGLRGVLDAEPTPTGVGTDARRLRWWGRSAQRSPARSGRRLLACVAASALVGVGTRWPVAAVLAACAVWVLPELVGPDRVHRARLARIEAVATWTEMLRDTLAAAAGLEQAIAATAAMAPAPIRLQVQALVARLERGDRLGDALRQLAADLDDPTADLVTAALVMAAERHARNIAELLSTLAAAAREQAGLRMRVAAGRARIRTSVRVVVIVTAAMAAGLVLLNRDYLQPYDSTLGQLVLMLVGGFFAAGIWWLIRISTLAEEPRLLTDLHQLHAPNAVPL